LVFAALGAAFTLSAQMTRAVFKIRYIELGTGEPVVLVHGFLENVEVSL
jgi:hypothetical protein